MTSMAVIRLSAIAKASTVTRRPWGATVSYRNLKRLLEGDRAPGQRSISQAKPSAGN